MHTTKLANRNPRKPHNGSPEVYAAAIREMLSQGYDISVLNLANHRALSQGLISQECFNSAAEVLAKSLLNQGGKE